MTDQLRKTPGLNRLAGLAFGLAAIAAASAVFGWPLSWSTAVIYGILQGIAMRWAVVMPGTGIHVVMLGGLMFEASWHHGFLTAAALILVEFAVRLLSLHSTRPYWEWFRPLLLIFSLGASEVLARAFRGNWVLYTHAGSPDVDTFAFLAVYAYWACLIGIGTFWRAPERGRKPASEYLLSMQQTWWVPLTMLGVSWAMEQAHQDPYNLLMVVGVGLLLIQYQAGTTFTAFFQDFAVGDLIRLYPPQHSGQRVRAQKVLRVAYGLARAMPLSNVDVRLVGYAALLQDFLPDAEPDRRPWEPGPLTPAEREALRRRVEAVARYVGQDGALTDVADLIRLRAVAYDGTGDPPLAGEAIPLVAQVLAVANAVVSLQEGARGLAATAEAVDWLQRNGAGRFSPRILAALTQAFRSGQAEALDEGLPETIRQLQRLMVGSEQPSAVFTGIRRMWAQLRGRVGLVPELPAEVQAVARLANFFASSTDPDHTAQIAVEAVGQLVGAKVTLAVSEEDEPGLRMRFRAAYGFSELHVIGLPVNMDGPPLYHGLLRREPFQVADLREINSPLAQEAARVESIRSVLFVPLAARGRLSGVLMVGMQSYHWFTPREIGLIQLMADQAAAALENARLMNEVAERLHHTENLKAFADTLLDNLSVAILVVDPEGLAVTVNASARRRFGDQDLELGRPLPGRLYDAFQVTRALNGESVPEADVRWGEEILEVQAVPLQDSRGTKLGAICLARDVTQVRTMETQVRRVEKLAAIGELAAGAAHEIRNPLTSIRGFIQLVQARAAAAEGEFFQIIINEIDRIDGIIRDLLLLARPTDLERVPTSLAGLLNEILVLGESKFKEQNVWVTADIDPAAETVTVDPKMFRQLLQNLVINALQAMPFGGTLRLTVRSAEPSGVALEVADTGVGISLENMKRLFVPFFTTKEEGTGLGLALCYSIVQAHGGRIDVESHEGLGTTFTVTLP
ncbi:MAG TPA: ATP-binding protein [Symbiobacteriaceae bacterium]|jgi:signal transduction histidine kinase